MSIALFLIFFSAFGQLELGNYLGILVVSLTSAIFFDLTISYIRVRKIFIPHAAVVTGLIISLLINPTLALWQIASISGIAMILKNFIRINNKHIFNPAALGLLVGGIIFNTSVAWWGSSFQYSSNLNVQTIILYIILLSPLYVSTYRMRRYFSIVSFIIVSAILVLITTGNFSLTTLSTTLFNPTIIFFSGVMLPEPMTSPSDRTRQILFGVTVAVLSFIIGSNFISSIVFIPDSLIASLLVANLIFFKK